MTFDPAIPTTLDRIRRIVGDTSNDAATEIFPDETYAAAIAEHTNWKLAAADMAEAVAVQIEADPSSVAFPQDISVSWSDRTRSLRATAVRLRAEAAVEDAAGGNAISSVSLKREGMSSGAEYRTDFYRRMRR